MLSLISIPLSVFVASPAMPLTPAQLATVVGLVREWQRATGEELCERYLNSEAALAQALVDQLAGSGSTSGRRVDAERRVERWRFAYRNPADRRNGCQFDGYRDRFREWLGTVTEPADDRRDIGAALAAIPSTPPAAPISDRDKALYTHDKPVVTAAVPWLLTRFIDQSLSRAFREQFPTSDTTPRELAVAAACATYNPAGVTPGLVEEVATAVRSNDIGRIVDRVLVDSCRGSGPASPSARMTLEAVVRLEAANPSYWLKDRLKRDVPDLSSLVVGRLVAGCSCWRQWSELGRESWERAAFTCLTHHHFAAWHPRTCLRRFVVNAIQCRELTPKQSHVRAFREGMLAGAVDDLRAGRVMRCRQDSLTKEAKGTKTKGKKKPRCFGEIVAASDSCKLCKRNGQVQKPEDYWLWYEGERVLRFVRKCGNCCYWYFRIVPNTSDHSHTAGGDTCGTATPTGYRPAQAWVPASGDEATVFDSVADHSSESRTRYLRQVRAEFGETSPAGQLAALLFHEGSPRSLADAAKELVAGDTRKKRAGATASGSWDTADDQFWEVVVDVLLYGLAGIEPTREARESIARCVQRTRELFQANAATEAADVAARKRIAALPSDLRQAVQRYIDAPPVTPSRSPLLKAILRLLYPNKANKMVAREVLDARAAIADDEVRGYAETLWREKARPRNDESPAAPAPTFDPNEDRYAAAIGAMAELLADPAQVNATEEVCE